MANKTTLIFLLLFLSSNLWCSLSNYSDEQLRLLKLSYKIGKQVKAKNGMSFERSLVSIVLTETNSGKSLLGDSFNKNQDRRHLLDNSLGPFQIRLSTVRFLSLKLKSLNFLKKKSNWYIMNRLLDDYAFGALIAANYLKYNYEKTKNNYFQAISRYNGGSKNFRYYKKVMYNMNIVSSLIKRNFF